MKYKCATTIEVPITQVGRNYFPLVQKLRGRKIYSINLINGVTPLSGGRSLPITAEVSISLTSDGRFYFWDNLHISRIAMTLNRGFNLPINREISTQDCFIFVPQGSNALGTKAILLVWYECEGYSRGTADNAPAYYDNFDVLITSDNKRNYLPDNRTIVDKAIIGLFAPLLASVTPQGHTAINTAETLNKTYITLVKDSFEVWDSVPCAILNQQGWWRYIQLDNLLFDLTSSYITVAQGESVDGYLNLQIQYKK